MKRVIIIIILTLVFSAVTVQAVRADEEPYEFDQKTLTHSLNESYNDLIPDSFDAESVVKAGLGIFSLSLKELVKAFTANVLMMAGIVMIAAVVSRIGESLSFKYSSDIIALAQILPVSLISYHVIGSLFETVGVYVEQINSLMSSYGCIMTEVYLLGGNVSAAAISSAWLAFALDMSRKICTGALIPLIRICFAVTIAASVSQSVNLRAISNFIRNIYTTASVLFMTVITVIMNFQTVVSASKDSVAMRSIRFAASNSVPVIGSLLSESMRTLTTGISYTKSYSGLVCIICLLAISALPAAQIFASKYTFSLAGSFADFLDVQSIANIIGDCGKLMNFMLGIVIITDVYFIYFITVFIKSVSAIG